MTRFRSVRSDVRLLLFDIDGTLLRSGGAGLRALNHAFAELFGPPDAFEGIPVAGRTDPLLLDDAAERAGICLDADARQRFHDRYCDRLEVEILKPGHRKGLMPGVTKLLSCLDDRRDLCIALLTGNFARAAQIKLEHFGLWQYFTCGAFGDDAADRDQLVPIAVERARGIGVEVSSPGRVIVIGDTPLDVRCATMSGAHSIAVTTGGFDQATLDAHGASAVLSDLSASDAFVSTLDGLSV